MTTRVVYNLATGERAEIPLTEAELADAAARLTTETAEKLIEAERDADVNFLPLHIKTLALLIGQYTGKTAAQVREDYTALYKFLKSRQ